MIRPALTRAAAVATLVVMALASCRTTTQDDVDALPAPVAEKAPVSGGRIAVGLETDPNGLDPTRNAFDPVGIQIANALYDPIAAFDPAGVAKPYLARSFEPSADFKTWIFRLREGVTFHSGAVLDAAAGKVFVEGILASKITGQAARYIDKIDTPDSMTLRFTMSRPWATFPALLTGQGGYVMSPEQVSNGFGHSNPDGTGPFRLEHWDQHRRLSLVKNQKYWREGLPYLDAVDFEVVTDPAARIKGLKDGSIDVTSVSNLGDVKMLNELIIERNRNGDGSHINVQKDPGATDASEVMLYTANPPFNNIHARRALAYATDVEGLTERLGWPKETIVDGPFPSTSPWYVPANPPKFDQGKARQELAAYEADTKQKLEFTMLVVAESAVGQDLVEQWKQVGIAAKISEVPYTEGVPRAVAGWYEAILFRYFAAPDPDVLWHFWTSETIRPKEISLNFTALADDQIDRALEQGRSTLDPATRKEAYGVVQQRFAELVPYVWLNRIEWYVASTDRVHNARNVTLPDNTSAMPFVTGTYRLTETWIDNGSKG